MLYEISHLDGDSKTFLVEAETAGKAKMSNYYSWSDVFNGTFKDYINRLIYCRKAERKAAE